MFTPQNGWFINNGKPYEQMDDLGVPLFLETAKNTAGISGGNDVSFVSEPHANQQQKTTKVCIETKGGT